MDSSTAPVNNPTAISSPTQQRVLSLDVLWRELFKLYKNNQIGELIAVANEHIAAHPYNAVKVLFLLSNLFGTFLPWPFFWNQHDFLRRTPWRN